MLYENVIAESSLNEIDRMAALTAARRADALVAAAFEVTGLLKSAWHKLVGSHGAKQPARWPAGSERTQCQSPRPRGC